MNSAVDERSDAAHRGDPDATRQRARSRRAAGIADQASAGVVVWLVKILLLGILDAVVVFAVFVLIGHREWLMVGIVVAVAAILNWIYLSRRKLPAKYLAPGVFFLIVFQIFTLVYTAYIGFTNYGTGHNGSKEQAVSALMASALERVPDSPTFPVTIVEQFGTFGFLITTPDGEALLGTAEQPLEPVDASFEGGKATGVDGWQTLLFADVLANQTAVTELSVPVSDDPNDGALRTPDGQRAYQYVSTLEYDAASATMTDTRTGTVYRDTGVGAFTSDTGAQLLPGWTIVVGVDNFTRALTEERIRGPLIYVTLWTFAFAAISVASTFFLGLFLAIVFNDMRMRGRKVYRILMILPYAFPSFLSALVWAGMMNQSFGFINEVLLGGASVPWLTDPVLAKVSVLIVNLWLGFPYMFLVCMGALQSIPDDIIEAAKVDGARPWGIFRLIKLPLLLVSVAPLLIASFAFNFNNFNLIYMLTNGGPRDSSASINVGHTDILISMVYKVAFTGQNRDYGLASAFSILIFIIVAVIAIISFRKTRALEDLN